MDRQQHFDLATIARTIIDSNFYMTLGTADERGRPWVSPVYYAHEGYANFYWVSSPEATHSRNLVGRPEMSIVIFDSRTPVGSGQGVYIVGKAVTSTEASPSSLADPTRTGLASGMWRTCARPLAIAYTGQPPLSTGCSARYAGGCR